MQRSNATEIVVQHSIEQEHQGMMQHPNVIENVPRNAEEAPPATFHHQDVVVITSTAEPSKPIMHDAEQTIQLKSENAPMIERRSSPARERGPDGRPVCTFWSQGKCFFGNECKFWHDMSNPPPIVPSDAEVHHFHVNKKPAPKISCKFFAVGECKYGPSCKFLHESDDPHPPRPHHRYSPPQSMHPSHHGHHHHHHPPHPLDMYEHDLLPPPPPMYPSPPQQQQFSAPQQGHYGAQPPQPQQQQQYVYTYQPVVGQSTVQDQYSLLNQPATAVYSPTPTMQPTSHQYHNSSLNPGLLQQPQQQGVVPQPPPPQQQVAYVQQAQMPSPNYPPMVQHVPMYEYDVAAPMQDDYMRRSYREVSPVYNRNQHYHHHRSGQPASHYRSRRGSDGDIGRPRSPRSSFRDVPAKRTYSQYDDAPSGYNDKQKRYRAYWCQMCQAQGVHASFQNEESLDSHIHQFHSSDSGWNSSPRYNQERGQDYVKRRKMV